MPHGYQDDWQVTFVYEKNGVPIGQRAHSDWLYEVPWGMYKALMYVKERYGNPTMILTENGMDQPGNVTIPDGLKDTQRMSYYRSYIQQLKKTVDDGANVIPPPQKHNNNHRISCRRRTSSVQLFRSHHPFSGHKPVHC